MSKLTPKFVKEVTEPGSYQDGRGLILRVTTTGRKAWIFRYSFAGVRHDLSLKTYPALSLRDARLAADAERVRISRGENPVENRRSTSRAARAKRDQARDFEALAREFVETHSETWSEAYSADWLASMENHVFHHLGKLHPAEVDTDKVLAVLRPIWTEIQTTAQRVRNRIELVLDASKALGLRTGENPARWRGHLDKLLPRHTKPKVPFPAVEWARTPAVYREVASLDGIAARALEFLILTACRSNEVRKAEWSEFDFEARLWTIPASRMKNRKVHMVPLTDSMIQVLDSVKGIHSRWVFKKAKGSGPLPANALSRVLVKAGESGVVPHGFRSTFRTWAAEATSFERDVCEVALAHTLPDKVEASYNRAVFLEKRLALMEAWSRFVEPTVAAEAA